jgi:NADPH:quinone reductase-like Zn-dependent oxidoreductase
MPDVLQLREVEKPEPKDNEVLVKVHAASVNAADWYLLTGKPFVVRFEAGIAKPKNTILGADVAGQVEAVGKHVTQFHQGDEVFGDISACGWGGFAEYVAVPEDALALKPANLSFEEAAAVPMAGVTALQGLRDQGQIRARQKVLIHGASGGVGTFAVQIAKAFETEVTAVCSASKVGMARSIGADRVIEYNKEDFVKNGKRYDLIIGANGYRSLTDYKRTLSPNGIYVCTGGSMKQIFESILLGGLMTRNGNKKILNLLSKPNKKDLVFLKQLIEAGKVKPAIDRTFALGEVPEALRYFGTRRAQGKIVITHS